MRSYCAVHVDVGYLLASAATYVTGSSLRRGITVDYPTLIARLVEQATADADLPLLRVNWYDSGARPGGMPDYQQEQIGMLPRVKLRLGRLSYSGDQKGVDLRIGLDLAIQGRNRVADIVYLVTGDDDLTEAVEEAQAHGVQVVLLAVPDHRGGVHGVSKHLRREVDSILVIDPETIAATVRATALPDGLRPDEGEAATDVAEGAPAPTDPDAGTKGTTAPAPSAAPAPPGREAATTETTETPAATTTASTASAPNAAPTSAEPTISPSTPAPPIAPPSLAPAPAAPSPAAFARRKATGVVLPGGAAADDLPDGVITDEVVDAVARQVVASWCATATPATLVTLRDQRPIIPGELDRALLLDLSGRAQDDDLDDAARHLVRDRFWFHVDRVRME